MIGPWRASLAAILGAASPGLAATVSEDEGKGEAVTISLSAPEQVSLLEPIDLRVQVTNEGTERLTVREPLLDERSFSFEVQKDDGATSVYTAYHPGAGSGSNVAGRYLEPGESMELLHAVPALEVGTWTFRPIYSGVKRGDPVRGESRSVRVVADGASTRAAMRIETTEGTMEACFLTAVAPATSLHVAVLVRDGFFPGTTFHRVIPGFMIQGGVKDERGAGYSIPAEFSDTPHVAGVLSMARLGDPAESTTRPPDLKYRDSARTSFFICDGESTFLNERYTAFARLIEGQEAVSKIANAERKENDFGEFSRPVAPVQLDVVTLVKRS